MSVNFTPNYESINGNLKTLKPFRFWCQKVLPLVYDDSLSYYELLNKVVQYLNDTMENVDGLNENVNTLDENVRAIYTAYNQLQGYVNNYFDNLDVQDEINNKLDDMVTDGTMNTLLIAVASPLIPTLVSDWLRDNITPTTPVVDATLSISGAAADAKVTGDKVTELKNAINVNDNDIIKGLASKESGTADSVATGYVDTLGEYHSNSGYKSYDYYITPGKYDKLAATGANNANSPKNISFITFIDDYTRTPACLIPSTDANIHTETVNVPSEANIVTICVAKNYVDTYGAPNVEFMTINSITEMAKKEETIIAENVAPTYLTHRYIEPATYLPTSTASSGWNLYKLNVEGIDKVFIRTYFKSGASTNLPFWTIVDSDFDEVTSTNQTSENIVSHDEKHSPTNNAVEIEVKIPVGGKTMLLCCATDNETNLVTITYNYHYFKELEFVEHVPTLVEKTNGLIVMKQSPYYRDVRWGCSCFNEYYHSNDNGTSEFTSSTTAEQYFTKFNSLVSNYSGYAESHEMGLASDETTMMYYYTFNPKTNQDSDLYKRPKIIVSAGQHGFEKTANFGVYYFAKDLLESWQNNPVLSYIRNHVQLILMPMLNPYGFNNDVYVNANGVNLNRNWDTTGWSKGTQGTTTYGGEEPLDQPETQYASAVILANLDALWLCDYHNNGQTAPSTQRGYLWHSFALVTYDDEYFKKAIQAAKWHIDETTGHLYVDYPSIVSYENSGSFTDDNAPSHQGLIVAYAREHNIMAATMEGGAAFIDNGNRYSSSIGHMNADLLGNWIRCLLATFSHYAE